MSQYGVVLNVFRGNKGRLHRRDDLRKHGFQSVGHNLNDDFVDYVTQADRSKVMGTCELDCLGINAM